MPVIIADHLVVPPLEVYTDIFGNAASFFFPARVHLFINDIFPTLDSELGDFVEASWTGYGFIASLTPGSYRIDADGSISTNDTSVLEWLGPSDDTGQVVYGYYLTPSGANTPLLGSFRFPEPVPMSVPTDVLNLVTGFRLPPIA